MSQYAGYQPNLPQNFHCANHPQREGVGICVSCRSVVCVECSTRIDRMNYCIRCLTAAAPQAEPRERSTRPAALVGVPLLLAALLMAAGVFAVMGYALALVRQLAPGGVSAG